MCDLHHRLMLLGGFLFFRHVSMKFLWWLALASMKGCLAAFPFFGYLVDKFVFEFFVLRLGIFKVSQHITGSFDGFV